MLPHGRRALGVARQPLTGAAALARDWQAFAARRYRPVQQIAIAQGLVNALSGVDLLLPFFVLLGASPALIPLIGTIPLAAPLIGLLLPRLLRLGGGDLRRVTLVATAVGEARGLALAPLALGAAVGWLSPAVAIVAIAVVMAVGTAASALAQITLALWFGAVLPEAERRFIAPRVQALSMGVGALLLLPAALAVEAGQAPLGLAIFALFPALAGVTALLELRGASRLPVPSGPLPVAPPRIHRSPPPADMAPFRRITLVSNFGAGFGPYFGLYAMSLLGAPAAYAIALTAVAGLSSLAAASVAGPYLARGSSARLLRVSLFMRGGGLLIALLAYPGNPVALEILLVSTVVVSAGAAAGIIASSERLYRLTPGPSRSEEQGRFLALSAVALSIGQLSSAAVLAISAGSLAFGLLAVVSGGLRLVALVMARPAVLGTFPEPFDRIREGARRVRAAAPRPLLQARRGAQAVRDRVAAGVPRPSGMTRRRTTNGRRRRGAIRRTSVAEATARIERLSRQLEDLGSTSLDTLRAVLTRRGDSG